MVSRKKKKKSKLSSVSATAGQLAKGEKADKVEKGEKDTEEYNDLRTPAQRKFDEVQAERVRRLSFYCDIISLPHNFTVQLPALHPFVALQWLACVHGCMVASRRWCSGSKGNGCVPVRVRVFPFLLPPFPPRPFLTNFLCIPF